MIKKIVIIVLLLGIWMSSIIVYHNCFSPKLGYIDIPKVFNGFEMKKQMEKKYLQTESMRNKIIDSLSMELQALSNRLRNDKKNKDLLHLFDIKREYFFNKKKQTDEDNESLSSQYDSQILEQMSTYIMEYGKKHNYDFVYGSSGNGTLMFANEKYNISNEITIYINNKYNGIE